jgi:hypothetical protein
MSSPATQLQPLKSADLEDLKQQQLDATLSEDGRGDIEHLTGNKDSSYQLPAREQNRVHLRLTKSVANDATESYDKTATYDSFSGPEFERMEKNEQFKEYSKVEIVHDGRPKARQRQDATGDVATGSPAEANKPLVSLQDAQMRYKELTKEDAPANKSFEELVALITPLEAKLKADKSTAGTTPRTLRTKADYQARYKELAGEEAPADKTVDELKEAIAHFEADKK